MQNINKKLSKTAIDFLPVENTDQRLATHREFIPPAYQTEHSAILKRSKAEDTEEKQRFRFQTDKEREQGNESDPHASIGEWPPVSFFPAICLRLMITHPG